MPNLVVSNENATDTPLVTTAETVIATLAGVSTSGPGKGVRLEAMAKITIGTGGTAVTLRFRRDSVSGTVVDESNVTQIATAAGSTEDHSLEADDFPSGEIFNATYVLTAQQAGASGNGSAVYAYVKATCE